MINISPQYSTRIQTALGNQTKKERAYCKGLKRSDIKRSNSFTRDRSISSRDMRSDGTISQIERVWAIRIIRYNYKLLNKYTPGIRIALLNKHSRMAMMIIDDKIGPHARKGDRDMCVGERQKEREREKTYA